MVIPWKTRNRATRWSSNFSLGQISKENHTSKRYMHPNVYCSTIYNSQDMEAIHKCPSIDKWIKMWYIYTTEYYSAINMNKIMLSAATQKDLEIQTKWSKSDREKQTSYGITYMWNLKKKKRSKWTYLQNRLTDWYYVRRSQMFSPQRRNGNYMM